MPSPQTAEAVRKFEKAISHWAKAPTQIRKSLGRTIKRVENSAAAFAAATAGLSITRPKKGGATRRKSKRGTRRK